MDAAPVPSRGRGAPRGRAPRYQLHSRGRFVPRGRAISCPPVTVAALSPVDAALAAPVPTRRQEIRERLVRLVARNAEHVVLSQQLSSQGEELTTQIQQVSTRAKELETQAKELETQTKELKTQAKELNTKAKELNTQAEELNTQVAADRREAELEEEAFARLIEEEQEMDERGLPGL